MKQEQCISCRTATLPINRKSGLCNACAWNHQLENARQLKEKKGPYYEKWKASMKAHAKDL